MFKDLSPLKGGYLGDTAVRSLLVVVNVVFCVLAVLVSPAINDDGARYLIQAMEFDRGGFGAAREIYNWPLYGFLIFVVHKITLLPYEVSAYLLNFIFYIVLFDYLYRLFRLDGVGEQSEIWFVLLLVCFSPINEYRDYIVRDVGCWSLLVAGVYYFRKYIQEGKVGSVIGWHLCLLLGSLFRVEAVVVYLLLPLALFLIPSLRVVARREFPFLLLPVLFLVGVVVIAWLAMGAPGEAMGKLTQFGQVASKYEAVVGEHISAISDKVMLGFTSDLAWVVYFGGMLAYMFAMLIKSLSYAWFLILLWSFLKREESLPLTNGRRCYEKVEVLAACILAVLLYFFAAYRTFTTTRYMMPAILLLLIAVAPLVVGFLKTTLPRKDWQSWILGFFLLYGVCDPFVSTGKKDVVVPRVGSEVAATVGTATVLSNDYMINYYGEIEGRFLPANCLDWSADRFQKYLSGEVLQSVDYLLLKIDGDVDGSEIMERVQRLLVARYDLGREGEVLLFRLRE